jgi:tape measure domain-containing protein
MADLTITIDARTLAGVQQAFQQVQKAFQDLQATTQRTANTSIPNLTRIQNSLQSLERSTRTASLAVTTALTALTTILYRAGANAIGTEARFRALSNSLQETKQTLEALRNTNAFILFGQQALDAAARLKAVGVASKDLPRLIEAIANAASTAGDRANEAFQRISEAIAQVATKGRASAEEIQQQLSEFIPAQKLIAQSLNITTGQLQQLMQQGLPAGKAIAALVQGIEQQFGKMSETIKNTPTGQLLMLRNTIQQLLTQAGSPLAQALSNLFQALRNTIQQLATSNTLPTLANNLAQLIRQLTPLLQTLLNFANKLLDTFNKLPSSLQNLLILLPLLANPLLKATQYAISFWKTLTQIYQWLRSGALANALARTFATTTTAGAATGAATGAGAATTATGAGLGATLRAFAQGALRAAGALGLALTPATASAQTAEWADAVTAVSAELRRRNPNLTPQAAQQQAIQFLQQHPQILQATTGTTERERMQRAAQAARQILNQPTTTTPQTTSFLQNLDALFSPIPKTTRTKTTHTPDPLAIQSARLELARQIASLQIEPIASLIDQNRFQEAQQRIRTLKAQLENLAKDYTQILIKQTEAQIQRQLTANEKAALAQIARRELLHDITNLEKQLADAQTKHEQQRLEAIQRERDTIAQAMREIHQLRIQLAEEQIRTLSPEEKRAKLPTLFALQAQPILAEIAQAFATGTDPQRALLQLAILQTQFQNRLQELNERIAQEQQRRAQEQFQLKQQLLQLETQITQTRAQAALEIAQAEVQNARDTLHLLQQQGAKRELLKAAQDALLNAQIKYLNTQKETLTLQKQSLTTQLQHLQAEYALLAITNNINLAQRKQLELQIAQTQLDIERTNAALKQLEIQIRNTQIIADQYNPFTLWQTALENALNQLPTLFANAILQINSLGNSLKNWFQNLARELLTILLRELLNPLLQALRAFATKLGQAILNAFGINKTPSTPPIAPPNPGNLKALGGTLGGILGAAGIAYSLAPQLRLNPTNSAIGAGIGFAVAGPIGALVGGLLGGLFGRKHHHTPPPVQIIPITTPRQTIRNYITLYLDNRELARAIATNTL